MTATSEITIKVNLDTEQFERDLARLTKKIGRVSGVPEWCYIPWMRGFVMGSALAAPVLAVVVGLGLR